MGGGVHSISVMCVYFLVAICILADPFLKMIQEIRQDCRHKMCVVVHFDDFVLVLKSN